MSRFSRRWRRQRIDAMCCVRIAQRLILTRRKGIENAAAQRILACHFHGIMPFVADAFEMR